MVIALQPLSRTHPMKLVVYSPVCYNRAMPSVIYSQQSSPVALSTQRLMGGGPCSGLEHALHF